MRVDRKYKIRHAILTFLFKKMKYNDLHFFNLSDSTTSVEDLAKELDFTVEEILTAHHGMSKHIDCNCSKGTHSIIIKSDGIDAYIDNYWLREGQKDLNERFYDKTKWIVPIAALIFTIISLSYTAFKTENSFKKINLLESELEKLNKSIKPNLFKKSQ